MHQDIVRIEGLQVDCVVGVYPHERSALQPLILDVAMRLDTEPAGKHESFRRTVDYAATSAQIVFLLRSCRFRLLETAAHVLAKYLLAPPAPGEQRAQLDRVEIRLRKPGAIGGFAVPSLEIARDRAWCELNHEQKPWGTVDVIHETRDVGVYRLNLGPGRAIPLHQHERMQETEMVLTKGVLCQRKATLPGTVFRWPARAAHCYDNPTDEWQSILCIDSPRFILEDEIEVSGAPADVHPEPPWGPVAWKP